MRRRTSTSTPPSPPPDPRSTLPPRAATRPGAGRAPKPAPATPRAALDARIAVAAERHRAGDLDAAGTIYRRVLVQDPAFADALNLLGAAAHQRRDLDRAAALMARALRVREQPEYAGNLALVLVLTGRTAEAEALLRRTLTRSPDFRPAHATLGRVREASGRGEAAIASYRRAARLDPASAGDLYNLAVVLHEHGRDAEAGMAFRAALAARPDSADAMAHLLHQAARAGDWSGHDAGSRRLRRLVAQGAPRVPPFIVLTLDSTADEQLAAARGWASEEERRARPALLPPRPLPSGDDQRVLRIGYLSGDFHHHATAMLTAGLFECHDRRGVTATGYSYGPDDGSPLRRRLERAFDRFVDLRSCSDLDAARRIHGDRIDILVDLKGYTRHARPGILAHRPAPIQVNYLGYPGTMGAGFIDYILVDTHIVPKDRQADFSERLVHLPVSYQVNDARRPRPRTVPSREACGLPATGFVFCCFNNGYKITAPVFASWMRLLGAVPGSVLWLLETDAAMAGNLRRAAQGHGVDPGRLVFAPWQPLDRHIARYAVADLFLDTLPVNAHTTASEALWAGLPVLTRSGATFAGRVAGSLLHAAGLSDLVVESQEAYEATALALARDPAALAAVRARLAASGGRLFDTAAFTRTLEGAYRAMWRFHCQGRPPTAFAVEAAPLPTGSSSPAASGAAVPGTGPDVGEAMQRHMRGDRAGAAAMYRRILADAPADSDALHLHGVVAYQGGDGRTAVSRIRRALRLREKGEYHANLGLALAGLGRTAEATVALRRALAMQPDNADAANNLGIALRKGNDGAAAAAAYRRALALRPDFADVWYNIGLNRKQQTGREEAVAAFDRAILLRPDYAEAHNNRAVVLRWMGRVDEAFAGYAQAIRSRPAYDQAHSNRGLLLKDLGRLDEAIAAHCRAIAITPDATDGYNNIGNTLLEQGVFDGAERFYRRALAVEPAFAEGHFNAGIALHSLRRPDLAADRFRRTLVCRPEFVDALGQLLHQTQQTCDWSAAPPESRVLALLRTGTGTIPPFVMLTLDSTAQDQLMAARRGAERLGEAAPPFAHPRPPAGAVARRVRLGYLSADFHQHATAFLIAELFERHDRERFEVFGYSYGIDDGSATRQRLVSAFDRFADVRSCAHDETARLIHADGIDILVDLKGYTQHARPGILPLRPAPVQVNYLGYPGTMGMDCVDYILVDPYIVPADQQSAYAERLVHLPGCYQVNDTKRPVSADTPTRASCGLPEDGFVFCCFNNSYKLTPAVFAVWMRLLRAVPGSVLWLLETNAAVTANLRATAAAQGVDGARLVFAKWQALPEHLARYPLADLFLDTLPVNAHTTASDALWAGLPVLTCSGSTFVARVAGSLLHAVGLPELVTTDLADYEATALRLAADRDGLAALRARLVAGRSRSPLFDITAFTRNIESAYATMWSLHCRGDAPRSFAVEPTAAPGPQEEAVVASAPRPAPGAGRRLVMDAGIGVLRGWLDGAAGGGAVPDFVIPLDHREPYRLPIGDDSVSIMELDDVLQCVHQPLALMQELHRIARPGASLLVRVPHGASEAAWADLGHVRPYFPGSFAGFAANAPRKGDPEYGGDWRTVRLAVGIAADLVDQDGEDAIRARLGVMWNVGRQLIAELQAVKPARDRHIPQDSPPRVEILREG